ncbi:P2 phage tail completion protein R (GpR) [Variovorax sp. YR752]|uniref:phage tail protein n=1 Tax=Variovorax sp. YR752 TaxID=1884383 RepID=UPI000BCD9C90|nr:phage tail protein [Variovorax sp. YR752]SOD27668.1 P2 phage tail completion protein R (GpR) [Variovorax sp. YR752]
MLKPHSLRAHLTAATPELQRDPDKLTIFITNGRLVAAGAASLSFVYRYTLKLVVLDYSSHADAIFVPLLAWLRTNQVEIFENTDLREKSLRFEAEYLNKETMDLSIEIDLTERVIVKPGTDPTSKETAKRYDVTHAAEPAHVGTVTQAERIEVYFEGQQLAAWDFPATEF